MNSLGQLNPMTSTPRIAPSPAQVRNALEVREAFTQFVGEAFYVQMFKAMRQTVDKPAYFHGGRGEEVFQSQLDQTMAEQMTQRSGGDLSEAMFDLQFPQQAAMLRAAEEEGIEPAPPGLDRLGSLRRAL